MEMAEFCREMLRLRPKMAKGYLPDLDWDVRCDVEWRKARSILQNLLTLKFGALSEEDRKRIAIGTLRELETWTIAVLYRDSVAEILRIPPQEEPTKESWEGEIMREIRPRVEEYVRSEAEQWEAGDILIRLLKHRFGDLSKEDRERIYEGTLAELDAWFALVPDASSVAEILCPRSGEANSSEA